MSNRYRCISNINLFIDLFCFPDPKRTKQIELDLTHVANKYIVNRLNRCLFRSPGGFGPTFWRCWVRWGRPIVLLGLGLVAPRHRPGFFALVWVRLENWKKIYFVWNSTWSADTAATRHQYQAAVQRDQVDIHEKVGKFAPPGREYRLTNCVVADGRWAEKWIFIRVTGTPPTKLLQPKGTVHYYWRYTPTSERRKDTAVHVPPCRPLCRLSLLA